MRGRWLLAAIGGLWAACLYGAPVAAHDGGQAIPDAPAPTFAAVSASSGEDRALDVVRLYFVAISRHEYRTAYDLLGAAMRRQQTYASFVAGLGDAGYDYWDWSTITSGASYWTIDMNLATLQPDGTYRISHGLYTVGYESGKLRIIAAAVEGGIYQSAGNP